jgi:hypothetical protein
VAAGGTAGPETIESTDESGAVTVTLSEGGHRVVGVAVSAEWRHRVPASGLGPAVLHAAIGPLQRRITEGVEAAARQLERSGAERSGTPSPPLPPGDAARIADTLTSLSWADVSQAFETVTRGLAALESLGRPGSFTPPTPVIARSPNRKVSVTLTFGRPVDVQVDETWAASVGRQQLSSALLQAFTAAYAQEAATASTATGGANPGSADALAPLAGVMAEMQSLMARLQIFPSGPVGRG